MNPHPTSGCKCQSCNVLFIPTANNRGRQEFCGELICRKKAKACANQKWRQKNPGHDSGPVQVARVQAWRANNPGYSGRQRRPKAPETPETLESLETPETPETPETTETPETPEVLEVLEVLEALQDSAPIQSVDNQTVADSAVEPVSVFAQRALDVPAAKSGNAEALQDLAHTQELLMVGLISVLLGDALQDSFVTYRRELVERGRRVLADNPEGLAA